MDIHIDMKVNVMVISSMGARAIGGKGCAKVITGL